MAKTGPGGKSGAGHTQLIPANLTGAAYGTYGSNVAGVYGNYGNALTNLYGAQGQANASGTVGAANALTGGITNANNSLYQNQLLNTLYNNQPAVQPTGSIGGWSNTQAQNFMNSGLIPQTTYQ